MGAIHCEREDAQAREQMQMMPDEVRAWICHHFGNSLCVVTGALYYITCELEAGRINLPDKETALINNANAAAQHMTEDLTVIRESERR